MRCCFISLLAVLCGCGPSGGEDVDAGPRLPDAGPRAPDAGGPYGGGWLCDHPALWEAEVTLDAPLVATAGWGCAELTNAPIVPVEVRWDRSDVDHEAELVRTCMRVVEAGPDSGLTVGTDVLLDVDERGFAVGRLFVRGPEPDVVIEARALAEDGHLVGRRVPVPSVREPIVLAEGAYDLVALSPRFFAEANRVHNMLGDSRDTTQEVLALGEAGERVAWLERGVTNLELVFSNQALAAELGRVPLPELPAAPSTVAIVSGRTGVWIVADDHAQFVGLSLTPSVVHPLSAAPLEAQRLGSDGLWFRVGETVGFASGAEPIGFQEVSGLVALAYGQLEEPGERWVLTRDGLFEVPVRFADPPPVDVADLEAGGAHRLVSVLGYAWGERGYVAYAHPDAPGPRLESLNVLAVAADSTGRETVALELASSDVRILDVSSGDPCFR